MSDWVVYLLKCADDSLYAGITTDIARRINEHNEDNNKGARYTRARRPVALVYTEQAENRSVASQREYAIKNLTRQQKIKLINGN